MWFDDGLDIVSSCVKTLLLVCMQCIWYLKRKEKQNLNREWILEGCDLVCTGLSKMFNVRSVKCYIVRWLKRECEMGASLDLLERICYRKRNEKPAWYWSKEWRKELGE